MAIHGIEKDIIERVKNGDYSIFRDFERGASTSLLMASRREFVQELIKVNPSAYGFATKYGEFTGDLELARFTAKIDDSQVQYFSSEFKQMPEFKDILTKREEVEKSIDDSRWIVYRAFSDKKLKLENMHPWVVKRHKNHIIEEIEKRITKFFEEKTKNLSNNDEVSDNLKRALRQKMMQFKNVIDEKLNLAAGYKTWLVDEKLANLEKLNTELKAFVKDMDNIISQQNQAKAQTEVENFEV